MSIRTGMIWVVSRRVVALILGCIPHQSFDFSSFSPPS
jgi:hypothetical protein